MFSAVSLPSGLISNKKQSWKSEIKAGLEEMWCWLIGNLEPLNCVFIEEKPWPAEKSYDRTTLSETLGSALLLLMLPDTSSSRESAHRWRGGKESAVFITNGFAFASASAIPGLMSRE
nr:hypothetical protein Iba_chr11dCG5370 [Ipomoea batatas]